MPTTKRLVILTVLIAIGVSCSSKDAKGSANRELIARTARKAVSTLQGSAESLGKSQLSDRIESDMSPYLVAMKDAAQSFPDAAGDDRKAKSLVTYVGMSLATLNSAQAAGGAALTGPYTSESAVLDELLKHADKKGVENFDSDELAEEAGRLLERFGEFTMLGDRALTDKVVPQDSPLRTNWDKDKDGRFEIPLPPAGLPGGTSDWQKFTVDMTFERDRGSLIGRMFLEVSYTAERLQLRLS
jgi:hypothetical protein